MKRCIRPDRLSRVLLISMDMPSHYSLALPLLKGYALRDPEVGRHIRIDTLNIVRRGKGSRMLGKAIMAALQHRPQLIGLSCNIWNAAFMKACCRWFGRLFPFTPILLGGQEITDPLQDICTDYPDADILIPGEGERPFQQVLRTLLESGWHGLAKVPGVHYRDENRQWHHTGVAQRITDLDSIPSPYLSGLAPIPASPAMGAMIEISRGCPLRCSFCFESERYPNAISFSMERVAAEFAHLRRAGHTKFHILDPILCLGDRIPSVHHALRDIDMTGTSTSAEIYADYVRPEDVPLMTFVDTCDIGLQTISPAAGKIIRRAFRRERFEAGFRSLAAAGKRTNIYLLAGLPGDTLQSFMAGVDYVTNLKPSQIFINPLLALRGTHLRASAAEHSLVYDREAPYFVRSCATFPAADLRKAQQLGGFLMPRHNNWPSQIHGTNPARVVTGNAAP